MPLEANVPELRSPLKGNFAVVGANHDSEGATQAGAAYIYRAMSDGTTSHSLHKLVALDTVADASFGDAVAIDAPYIDVGASRDSHAGDFSESA